MRNKFVSLLVIFVMIFSPFSHAHASSSASFSVASGTDTTDGNTTALSTPAGACGTISNFSPDTCRLSVSDNFRLKSNGAWPVGTAYDESKYIEFAFSPNIPVGATVSSVMITNEYRNSNTTEVNHAKLEVWDGATFTDEALSNNNTTDDMTDTVDVSSLINSPDKVNGIKVRFLAYRDNAGSAFTSHDYIGVNVVYDAPLLDTTPPVITLLGSPTVSLTQGTAYTDAGATAVDNADGDITSKIKNNITRTNPDINTPGTYTVTYNVSDTAGNMATPVTRTVTVTASVPPTNETILIRNGNSVIYSGSIPLPAVGTISIPDDTAVAHNVDDRSVLGVLYALGQSSGSYSVSDTKYYSSFNELYLKCITPTSASPLCDSWQYVVNGTAPATGMDSTILSGGETLGIYFGTPHSVSLSATSVTAGTPFTATAQKYNYVDNTWSPLTGVTIGATQPNPSDPYNPTVVVSQAVDTNGVATMNLANTGTYSVGISEDYYFPSYTITVTPSGNGGGGGGGGGGGNPIFSVLNALNFLKGVQGTDGSFGSDMYTDWAGVAFASAGASTTNILSYMSSHNTVSGNLTDNERHAIALLSLGQNPYSFNGTDFVTPIVNAFDGTQFGDAHLDNDDIFALITLASAGYTASDSIITKDVAFVISAQQSNGSWDGSPDMTSAGIQALKQFSGVAGVSDAIAKANSYLSSSQGSDGGWGNVSSTSWAMQAMNTLGASWTNGGHTPADYLGANQATDGAASPVSETLQNRIWATSYAIPAALGKPWSAIMQPVSKPIVQNNGGSGGGGILNNGSNTVDNTKKDNKTLPTNTNDIVASADSVATDTESASDGATADDISLLSADKDFPNTVSPMISNPTESTATSRDGAVANQTANAGSSGASPAVPFILGALSGAILLYVVSRRFVK